MTRDLTIKTVLDDANVQAGLSGMEKKGVGLGAKMTKGFSPVVKQLGAIALAAATVSTAVNLAKSAFGAYITEMESIKGVNDALAATNQLTAENSQLLQDNASAIQSVTTLGNEYVLDLQAQQVLLGANANETLSLTKAALGLAKSYKQDAKPILVQINQLVDGQKDKLSKLGIEVDSGATRQERLNAVMEAGAAGFIALQGETDTYSGSLKSLDNTWGDYLETLTGATGITMPAVVEAVKGITTIIGIYDVALKDSSKNTENSNNETLSSFANLFKGVGKAAVAVIGTVTFFVNSVGVLVASTKILLKQAESEFLESQIRGFGDDFLSQAPLLIELEKVNKELIQLKINGGSSADKLIEGYGTALDAIEALDIAAGKISRKRLIGESPLNTINATTAGVDDLATAMKKAKEKADKLGEAGNEAATDMLFAFRDFNEKDGGLVDTIELMQKLNEEFDEAAQKTFFDKLREEFKGELSLFPTFTPADPSSPSFQREGRESLGGVGATPPTGAAWSCDGTDRVLIDQRTGTVLQRIKNSPS